MAAGMGAGIAAIFRAPLAGALFAAEVLYRSPDFESEVIIPAGLASVIAYCTFGLVFGWAPLFSLPPELLDVLTFNSPLHLVSYTCLARRERLETGRSTRMCGNPQRLHAQKELAIRVYALRPSSPGRERLSRRFLEKHLFRAGSFQRLDQSSASEPRISASDGFRARSPPGYGNRLARARALRSPFGSFTAMVPLQQSESFPRSGRGHHVQDRPGFFEIGRAR
jgi:hypothetical protein